MRSILDCERDCTVSLHFVPKHCEPTPIRTRALQTGDEA